ncbi:MAG: hypothetical protein KGI98_14525 [Euryarchaeota archaeon]|nr:hypothetical protein [Euryarchaeota archaeon]MDE1881160.1 hypothetical protein [Euryarchaeota archaeon]
MSRKRTAPTDVTDGGFKSGRAYALEEWDCPDPPLRGQIRRSIPGLIRQAKARGVHLTAKRAAELLGFHYRAGHVQEPTFEQLVQELAQ